MLGSYLDFFHGDPKSPPTLIEYSTMYTYDLKPKKCQVCTIDSTYLCMSYIRSEQMLHNKIYYMSHN